jgi:YggT family protein
LRLLGEVIWWALAVYMWMIVARAIITWLPVKWPRGVRSLVVLIYDLTEPVLSPLRRIVPTVPVGSGMGLDLTPMVVIVLILFLQWLVRGLFG